MCFSTVREEGNVLKARGAEPSDVIGFPESFQRTTQDVISDDFSDSEAHSEISSLSLPRAPSLNDQVTRTNSSNSRSSVMRLENILNAVSIGPVSHRRSKSLESPSQSFQSETVTTAHIPELATRSHSPDESMVKKKKVKLHRCPECQKDFPRPSGLRTHMNMHTKEKPYACNFPGCTRSFSVVSNAKRHMRTHGMGINSDESESVSIPYVVGFEDPVIISSPQAGHTPRSSDSPVRLRWISSSLEERRGSLDSSFAGTILEFSERQILSSSSMQQA